MQQTKVENAQEELLLKSSEAFRARLRAVVNFFNSNTEVAEQIGATETTIRRWLQGTAEPRKPALAKLSAAPRSTRDISCTGWQPAPRC